MCPVVAPVGTSTTIFRPASDLIVALVPLNDTFDACFKCPPLMETVVPGGPEVGEKLLIFGGETMGVGVGVGVGGVPVTVTVACISV